MTLEQLVPVEKAVNDRLDEVDPQREPDKMPGD
jgi:hypothetical protein